VAASARLETPEGPARLELVFVKVGGRWLVDASRRWPLGE
jgi:hypothetical protein